MTTSSVNKVSMPVRVRPTHRTWQSVNGKVVTAEKVEPPAPAQTSVDWEAHVVDTATDTDVAHYPTIAGTVSVAEGTDPSGDIEAAYIVQCKYTDGDKLDVDKLIKNVQAGIWEIHHKVPEPA
jgi:hypothetical protein